MANPTTKTRGPPAPFTAAAYVQYAEALNRYLVRRVRCPEDASDLSQEIFELYLRRYRQPEAIRNPLAYLFRIAFHVVSGALSRQTRDRVTCDSELFDVYASGEPDSRNSTEEAEELAVQDDILAALATLPENYMTALMLVEGEGMSYDEAAAASGFTRNTVKTYLMHGRAALKHALDDRSKARDGRK